MNAKPFLKWAGGKRQLLPEILKRVPEFTGTYHEPFLGGGAVYFALADKHKGDAMISDTNDRLMMTYMGVAHQDEAVIKHLGTFEDSPECFNSSRNALNAIDLDDTDNAYRIAALMIYVNKCGFNGLYRENSRGQINTPYGNTAFKRGKPAKFLDEPNLRAASALLERAALNNWHFTDAFNQAKAGDFMYLDPPYLPVSDTSFTKYTGAGFSTDDHEQLATCCREADRKGIKFLLSNSDTAKARELYTGFKIEVVEARRAINSKGTGRGRVNELLISNF